MNYAFGENKQTSFDHVEHFSFSYSSSYELDHIVCSTVFFFTFYIFGLSEGSNENRKQNKTKLSMEEK